MTRFFHLFLLLRRNTKLNEKRNVMFEANQYGKLFGYIAIAFVMIYLIALGTFMGWAAADSQSEEIIFFLLPFLLMLDFFMRFISQQTPLMLVKPYLLLPISRYTAIDCFLINQLLSTGILVWLAFFLPYTFICVCGGVPLLKGAGMVLLMLLMFVVNSQWYLLNRTLTNHHMVWWALPTLFYGSWFAPILFISDRQADRLLDNIIVFLSKYGFSWATFFVFVLLLVVLYIINRKLQMSLIYDEISKQEKTKLKHVSEFSMLNRFGQVGEYLKLEIKSTMRNKAIRTRFLQGVGIITMFSLLVAYTDVYNSDIMLNFWCLYCFVFFGAVNLIKVMCPEGNYIDLLMVHEENILTLLRAKYFFYLSILVLPLLLLLPAIISGKFSPLMITVYFFFTAGPEYCMLFLMAIWNKQTLPLNDKITGKNQMENKLQIIIELVVFFVPVVLVRLFQAIFGTTMGYVLLAIIGLAFTLAMPIWMRMIYRCMMKRRYTNLEGFHTSR